LHQTHNQIRTKIAKHFPLRALREKVGLHSQAYFSLSSKNELNGIYNNKIFKPHIPLIRMRTKRKIVFGVFLISLILAVSVVVVAKPNIDNLRDIVPAHAVQVSEGVFSLGEAVDVDGRVVEGFMFVYKDKRGNAKPGTVCGNNICEPGEKKSCSQDCSGGGSEEPKGPSSCYSLFAKGAKWKETEPYVTGNGVDLALTEASLETWDSEVAFNIFGLGSQGVTDGADDVSPDGKNEVELQNLGPSNTIAYTIVWGIFGGPPKNRVLVEWDAVFNTDYPFGDADSDTLPLMDYQNIATHEFGHALGLKHPENTCTEETMYFEADFNETKKRSLEAGDLTGLGKLY